MERLGWGYWLVGIVAVVGAVYYWNTKHPFDQPTIVSAPSPTPAIEAAEAFVATPVVAQPITAITPINPVSPSHPAEPATPVSPSSNELSPQAQAQPELYDVPVVIRYDELAQNPKNCPKKLRLKEDVNFPAMVDGKQVGTVLAPAGSEVDFIKVTGEKSILVGFGPAELAVNADLTNFEDLYTANVKASRRQH